MVRMESALKALHYPFQALSTVSRSSYIAGNHLSSSHENYSPQVIQRLSREIQGLVRNPPDGVTFVPNEDDCITEVFCDIAGPGEP